MNDNMSESEETKQVQEHRFSSVTEGVTPSLEVPASLAEAKPAGGNFRATEPPQEVLPETLSSKKMELKKHSPLGPHPAITPTSPSVLAENSAVMSSNQEKVANMPQVGIEVEIDFILDRKRIPLTELRTLAEGEILTLSGADFRATLFLQEKAIAEAALVMVDQRPSIQITKIFSGS